MYMNALAKKYNFSLDVPLKDLPKNILDILLYGKATALDSIVDVVTTSLVLVCSVASLYTPVMLDGWAGIIVSFFIFLTACKALKEPIDLLLGTAPDPTLVSEIEEFVKQYPDIIKIHDLVQCRTAR